MLKWMGWTGEEQIVQVLEAIGGPEKVVSLIQTVLKRQKEILHRFVGFAFSTPSFYDNI